MPVSDKLNLEFASFVGSASVRMFNNLGLMICEEDVIFKDGNAVLKTDNLLDGVYFLEINCNNQGTLMKQL